ncbi:MAG: hypothetical protein MHM6MM_009045, partial [Cercozoa sp. M6MM]
MAVAKFGEFLLNALPKAKAVTIAVLSGLPVECVRRFVHKPTPAFVSLAGGNASAAYNASFAYWLRRVNARRFAEDPGNPMWDTKPASPELDARLMAYDEEANRLFAQLLAGLYLDEGFYVSTMPGMTAAPLEGPALQPPPPSAASAIESGEPDSPNGWNVFGGLGDLVSGAVNLFAKSPDQPAQELPPLRCTFRRKMAAYVAARFDDLKHPGASPDPQYGCYVTVNRIDNDVSLNHYSVLPRSHLVDSRTRVTFHFTSSFYFSATSMALMSGMLPVEAFSFQGRTTTDVLRRLEVAPAGIDMGTRVPDCGDQQMPELQPGEGWTVRDHPFRHGLVNNLTELGLNIRERCTLYGGILVHRLVATVARWVALADRECREARKSANESLWLVSLQDALNTQVPNLARRLPGPVVAAEPQNETEETKLNLVDSVENVLRVVGSSTSFKHVLGLTRGIPKGAEPLSSVTDHVSIVDTCLIADLGGLPTAGARPELRATPLFEVALKALVKR